MFLENLRSMILNDEAGDGTEGAGGGGGEGGADTATALDGGAEPGKESPASDSGAEAKPAAKETALSKNASTDDPFFGVPEKYRVMRDDGTLDEQATLAKTAAAHSALATKMGQADGVPPAAPGDYEINMPGEMGAEFDQEDPGFKEFLTEAHAAGFTQKQLDTAMNAFGKTIGKLTGDLAALNEQECNEQLAEIWKTDQEKAAGYQSAFRAVKAFSGERFDDINAKYGNDPDMIWMMAEVGKQLRESSPPADGEDSPPDNSGQMAQIVKDLGSKDKAVRLKAEADFARLQQQTN